MWPSKLGRSPYLSSSLAVMAATKPHMDPNKDRKAETAIRANDHDKKFLSGKYIHFASSSDWSDLTPNKIRQTAEIIPEK